MVQKNERIKSVGKVKLITGRYLPKREGINRWGSLEASKKSQECWRKREGSRRIPLEGQRTRGKGREVLQKRLGNEEGGGGMARRIPKEPQGI